jgi:hypothetical protein
VTVPRIVPPVYIAVPVCCVLKYTNLIELEPVAVVEAVKAAGSPPAQSICGADGLVIVVQQLSVTVIIAFCVHALFASFTVTV